MKRWVASLNVRKALNLNTPVTETHSVAEKIPERYPRPSQWSLQNYGDLETGLELVPFRFSQMKKPLVPEVIQG